jgi:hypothetical protein
LIRERERERERESGYEVSRFNYDSQVCGARKEEVEVSSDMAYGGNE